MNAPLPDDHQSLRDTLQRDAARASEPAFDPALHQATMRRIRALTAAKATTPWFASWPALVSAAAGLAIVAVAALWPSRPSLPHGPAAAIAIAPRPAPHASLLEYQTAARKGDAALFATLDHDAAELLPATSPVFKLDLQ